MEEVGVEGRGGGEVRDRERCAGPSIGGLVWGGLRGSWVWAKAKMTRVLAFVACLVRLGTWRDGVLGWVKSLLFRPAEIESTSAGHVSLVEGLEESEFARFLSSLREDNRWCRGVIMFDGGVTLEFGPDRNRFYYKGGVGGDMGGGYTEFLAAVASSKTMRRGILYISVNMYNYEPEHVGKIVQALRQSGNDFRELSFQSGCSSPIQFGKCVASVLQMCDGIEDLSLGLRFGKAEGMGKEEIVELMANIAGPNSLRILRTFAMNVEELGGEEMEEVMKPFMDPSNVLKVLSLWGITSDVGLKHVSAMVASSMSLRSLYLRDVGNGGKGGYTSLGAALLSNQSLEYLDCKIFGIEDLKAVLDPLMPKVSNGKHNTTLTSLQLLGDIGGQEGVEFLAEMLHKSTSLLHLYLQGLDDLQTKDPHGLENVLAILEALKANTSLKAISFEHCSAVGGSKVLGSMMDLLLENHCIEDIGLGRTPLAKSGDAEYVGSALSKRKKMRLWDVVQGMANVRPTSGRVFLCGEPYAGKTQLRTTMMLLPEVQAKHKGGKRKRAWIQNLFKHQAKSQEKKEEKVLPRTRGIEVASVACDGIGITIWDMAGQAEYHSFHELVMPSLSADGSCSLFMLLCNPMEQPALSKRRNPMEQLSLSKRRNPLEIKAEIETWLRMIASNTRRSLKYRPHVCIVMSHFDHWRDDNAFGDRIVEVVEELRSQFEEVLEFDKDKVVFKVDGRMESDAHDVFEFMRCHMKQLLERLPPSIGACEEVQRRIAEWNVECSEQPILKWDEFCKGVCKGVEGFEDGDLELAKRRREFVAIALNDGGHIIYNEEGGTVITNPHWFCHDIMGEFLNQCAKDGHELGIMLQNGMISMKHMKGLMFPLIKVEGDMEKSFDDILGVMKKFHVCYERDANEIMIPSMLEDKRHCLKWCEDSKRRGGCVYVGRRLACKDGRKTMLSAGFFARLQVSLFKKLQNPNDKITYELYQDVIQYRSDGFEVILEFKSGDIDILLSSCHSQDAMLKFLDDQIVRHIKHLQEDPMLGCLGVLLEEYVLRPACVEKLTSFEHRKNQYVCTKDLEVQVLRSGFEAKHNWKSCEGLDNGYDEVKLLLGGAAWTSLLKRRANSLGKYEMELTSLGAIVPSDMKCIEGRHSSSSASILGRLHRYAFAPVFTKLDELSSRRDEQHRKVISRLDDLKVMIENLEKSIKSMERNLLQEVCAKIDKLMAISKEMQASQIPKLAYLCKIGERKLLTKCVPGLTKFHLHLMCESIEGFHEVANQRGCTVTFGTEQTKRMMAMLDWGLKIAIVLLKIGAHVACGMGEMVPDWSKGSHLVALILDTPDVLDGGASISSVELLPDGVREHERIRVDEGSEAQRWMVDFLEPKCGRRWEFHKMFELTKVRYKCEGGSVAWICDACKKKQRGDVEVL